MSGGAGIGSRGGVPRRTTQSGFVRGRPIRAGWNSTAAAIVQTSANAINLPMLEVAGSLDSHKLPKALAVAIALKITARVKVDCTRAVFPLRQAMM
jgi:hypothetical protein